ncbi:hypothetical protein JRO89_XS05G0092600 [Xanthoceras sorbifolium]|uniref:NADP-dependent oxidoreductase domain-containing protein n=1 Tax=Xanthoceras sorbifolium TaxID=99658 RepID=A0ABQ8I154_9ROSI|nr:hypothetical protein JRO89_XS05G0092600 [Xanthoceras sorbifolium]
MGMAADPFDEIALKSAVVEAIRLGYRHFDTAPLYRSEKPLGVAIVEALISSKLWSGDPDLAVSSIKNSLRFVLDGKLIKELFWWLRLKSFNKERMREIFLEIFDWTLSEGDYEKINQIQQQRLMPTQLLVSSFRPFKSLEELWDGEL